MKGACYLVGDGKSINIWTEPWVPNIPDFRVQPEQDMNHLPTFVAELIDNQRNEWKEDLLSELFSPITVQEILKIKFPVYPREDQ